MVVCTIIIDRCWFALYHGVLPVGRLRVHLLDCESLAVPAISAPRESKPCTPQRRCTGKLRGGVCSSAPRMATLTRTRSRGPAPWVPRLQGSGCVATEHSQVARAKGHSVQLLGFCFAHGTIVVWANDPNHIWVSQTHIVQSC